MNKTISIAKAFTEYPGLRHCSISDDSGEDFYHKVLNREFKEALDENKKLIIDLDNTAGYAPSFLDETFGNLVFDFSYETVKENIEIISFQEPSWIDMIMNQTLNEWEERRVENNSPKITGNHEPWYRLSDGVLKLQKWS